MLLRGINNTTTTTTTNNNNNNNHSWIPQASPSSALGERLTGTSGDFVQDFVIIPKTFGHYPAF